MKTIVIPKEAWPKPPYTTQHSNAGEREPTTTSSSTRGLAGTNSVIWAMVSIVTALVAAALSEAHHSPAIAEHVTLKWTGNLPIWLLVLVVAAAVAMLLLSWRIRQPHNRVEVFVVSIFALGVQVSSHCVPREELLRVGTVSSSLSDDDDENKNNCMNLKHWFSSATPLPTPHKSVKFWHRDEIRDCVVVERILAHCVRNCLVLRLNTKQLLDDNAPDTKAASVSPPRTERQPPQVFELFPGLCHLSYMECLELRQDIMESMQACGMLPRQTQKQTWEET